MIVADIKKKAHIVEYILFLWLSTSPLGVVQQLASWRRSG